MYGIALVITVTLIIITLLILPVSLRLELSLNAVITLDLTLFAIVFTKNNSKNNKTNKPKTPSFAKKNRLRFQDIAKYFSIFLKRVHVEVKKIILTDTATLSQAIFFTPFLYSCVSILLAILSNKAKSFSIAQSEYIVTKNNDINRIIDVSFSFFLFDLFIVAFKVLYLELSKHMRRHKHDRIRNR